MKGAEDAVRTVCLQTSELEDPKTQLREHPLASVYRRDRTSTVGPEDGKVGFLERLSRDGSRRLSVKYRVSSD